MSKVKAVNGHIVLRPAKEDEDTMYGNIALPEFGEDTRDIGIVVDISAPINHYTGKEMELQVKVGDKVVLPKMSAQKIEVETQEYWITNTNNISAIIKE